MLTVGIVHGELASLLWGGAFGFVWCYTSVVCLLVARHPRVRLPRGRLDCVPDARLVFRGDLPPTPAFFHWSLVATLVHSPSRTFVRRGELKGTGVDLDLALPRGRYAVRAWWELSDAFGLTKLVPRVCWETLLVVEPQPLPFTPPPPPVTKPGPWRPRRVGRRAGDPFDVRHYLPGDDLRRLHWPLYAHAGVPFVRTAEPSPPPTGHQFLILDTEADSEDILDDRLARLVTWLQILDSQATGWTLVIPAGDTMVTTNPGTLLAGLTPAHLPDRPVDHRWPETVSLVTGPGSLGAARLARQLAATRRRYRPVVIPTPIPSPEKPRQWWRRRS